MDATGAPDAARISDKRPREECHNSPARKRHRLVDRRVRAKEADPLMAAQMGHLRLLTENPKRRNYQPKRNQRATENPSSTVLFDQVIASLHPALKKEVGVHHGKKWGVIQGGVQIEPNLQTPLRTPRMVVCSEGSLSVTFKFEAMYMSLVCGRLPEDNDRFNEFVQTLLPGSGYFLCQGLPSDVASLITYDTKSARKWGLPFGRVDHKECPMWLSIGSTAGSSHGGQPVRCVKCSKLMYYVRREAKKRESVTPDQEAARVLASSHFPMKFLSPASLQTRAKKIAQENKLLKQKLNGSSLSKQSSCRST